MNTQQQHTFPTRHAAQEYANLRSMVDGLTVRGPFILGASWAVIVDAPAGGHVYTCTACGYTVKRSTVAAILLAERLHVNVSHATHGGAYITEHRPR